MGDAVFLQFIHFICLKNPVVLVVMVVYVSFLRAYLNKCTVLEGILGPPNLFVTLVTLEGITMCSFILTCRYFKDV